MLDYKYRFEQHFIIVKSWMWQVHAQHWHYDLTKATDETDVLRPPESKQDSETGQNLLAFEGSFFFS